jgi:hypothetical protein
MESFIRGIKDTPPMALINASPHAQVTQSAYFDYYGGVTAKYRVTGLGAGGQLDLVALLPVSGHVGLQAAENYARTNQYNVVITHADGTRQTLPKVAATGFVTEHALSLNLKPGKTIVQFWPDGSGGVGGYQTGREIEFHWDGN